MNRISEMPDLKRIIKTQVLTIKLAILLSRDVYSRNM